MLAEQDQDDNWTNYIYAGGKKIAMIPGTETQLFTSVVTTGNDNEERWNLPTPTNADGTPYTIKTGDHLCWRQFNTGGALGGPAVFFSNGFSTAWTLGDMETGAAINQGGTQNAWASRCADLSYGGGATGFVINTFSVLIDFTPPPGNWGVRYADMSITSTDGTVTPIVLNAVQGDFQGSTHSPPVWGTVSVPLESDPTESLWAYSASTHYFLADQVGTTQLEFASGGYPVWRGDFAPFGQELDVQATANRYKFTGKERDIESGLDYFGARYYASSMGRFMSPDWAAKAEPVPYAMLADPQSLNLYSYVRNNPLSSVDVDGHVAGPNDAQPTGSGGGNVLQDETHNSGTAAKLAFWSSYITGQPAQQQSGTSSTEAQNEQHQYDLVVERTNKLLGGAKDSDGDVINAADHISSACGLVGGNCEFKIKNGDADSDFRSALNKSLGEADGDTGAHGGLSAPTHRVGFSTSLHHDNDALHVDHYNGAKFPLGTLLHAIVDVGVGHLPYYGSNHAFSYAGVQ